MNLFSLLTILGGMGAIYAYFRGVTSAIGYSHTPAGAAVRSKWHRVFDFCVSLTILAALTSL